MHKRYTHLSILTPALHAPSSSTGQLVLVNCALATSSTALDRVLEVG